MVEPRTIYAAAMRNNSGFLIYIGKEDADALGLQDRDEIKAVISKTGRVKEKTSGLNFKKRDDSSIRE
jgi:hypothetical protein